MVPEVQCEMLAPPFMDHWMTLELGLMRTNCQTHARHGVKHCSPGNGLRQMIQGWTHPAAAISNSAGRWSQMPGAPKRKLSA
jgi:hypothetical protein